MSENYGGAGTDLTTAKEKHQVTGGRQDVEETEAMGRQVKVEGVHVRLGCGWQRSWDINTRTRE